MQPNHQNVASARRTYASLQRSLNALTEEDIDRMKAAQQKRNRRAQRTIALRASQSVKAG